jgi:aspartate/methionine/tyrosine aminotransferase
MEEIEPFHVMKILARAHELEAEGRSIVHMEVGEPDFETAKPIVEAGVASLRQGKTHYTPATGIVALREAISGYYRQRYQVAIGPDRIAVTPGATGALQLVLGVLIDPGEEVIMADPGYPCNRHYVRMAEGKTVAVPVTADTGYQLTAELADRYWTDRTKAVLVATPANPTGTMIDEKEMGELVSLVRRRGGKLIVDEIYHGLTYGVDAKTVLSLGDEPTEDVFVINSFSKYFGMTGWRIGWLVAPEQYMGPLDRLAQNVVLSVSTPAQYAALKALSPEVREIHELRRDKFEARRDFLLPALREIGFRIPVAPQGAFYLYADCSDLTEDTFECSARILEQAGVAVTPGRDFGSNLADRHIRFAYTTSLESLHEGVERLARFFGRAS